MSMDIGCGEDGLSEGSPLLITQPYQHGCR